MFWELPALPNAFLSRRQRIISMNQKNVWPAIVAVILIGVGCVSDGEKLKRQVSILVNDKKYDEARALVLNKRVEEVRALEQNKKLDVNVAPLQTPKQRAMRNEMLTLIDRAEAKYIADRTKELSDHVLADLKKGVLFSIILLDWHSCIFLFFYFCNQRCNSIM